MTWFSTVVFTWLANDLNTHAFSVNLISWPKMQPFTWTFCHQTFPIWNGSGTSPCFWMCEIRPNQVTAAHSCPLHTVYMHPFIKIKSCIGQIRFVILSFSFVVSWILLTEDVRKSVHGDDDRNSSFPFCVNYSFALLFLLLANISGLFGFFFGR